MTLEMPGRLKLLVNDEYEADADEVEFEEHSDFMSASVASTAATAMTTKACFRWDFRERLCPVCSQVHRLFP